MKIRTIEKTKEGKYIFGEFDGSKWHRTQFEDTETLSEFVLERYAHEYKT